MLLGISAVNAGDILAVGHKSDNSIGFYDCTSGRLLKKLDGIVRPHEMCASRDGRLAFVSHDSPESNSLTIVDLAKREVVGSVPLSETGGPHALYVGRSGAIYAVAARPPTMLIVEPQKRVVLKSLNLVEMSFNAIIADEREQFAYAANSKSGIVAAIDLNKAEITRLIPVLGQPVGLTFGQDGRLLYVANRHSNSIAIVDVASSRAIGRWWVPGHPVRLALLANRGVLLSAQVHTGDLAMISLADGSDLARMPIGHRVSSLVVDCDANYAYASAAASNTVVQVSLKDWKRARIFRTSPGPTPILVFKDGGSPYCTTAK